MRKRDLIEIKSLDIAALRGKAQVVRHELSGFVLDGNMRKLKDLKTVSKKRKDLAQILTVLRQKEQMAELGGAL